MRFVAGQGYGSGRGARLAGRVGREFPVRRVAAVRAAAIALLLLASTVGACALGPAAPGMVRGTVLGPVLGTVRGGGLHGAGGGRSQGYLGIEFHDAPGDSAGGPHTKASRGVEVVMVDHDGPAGKAGLRPHDIILALNGQAIAGAEALRRMIHDAGAGVQIALQVMRGGKPMVISAQLAERDEVARAAMARLAAADSTPSAPAEASGLGSSFAEGGLAMMPSSPPPPEPVHNQGFLSSMLHMPFTGVEMETMEPQLATYFGAPKGMGLLVHSVAPNSPAALCGLRAGDVILRADLYALRTQSDWTRRLHAARGGPMNLDVMRDRHEFNVTLQPDLRHHSLLEWPLRS